MNPEREDAVEREGDTPDCNCASRGMLEGIRHGRMCPYGLRKLCEWQEANSSPPVRSQPGQLVAEAWREYLARHRDEFARDLEKAATLLRDGTLDDVAAFASRKAATRAKI